MRLKTPKGMRQRAAINPVVLAGINTTFNMAFNEGLDMADPFWEDVASDFPSLSEEQVYPFMMGIGGMKRWNGEKKHQDVSGQFIKLINEDFSDGIEVDRNKIDDDQISLYAGMVTEIGQAAANLVNYEVIDLLDNYSTVPEGSPPGNRKAWDGLNFFHTAHPVDPRRTDLGNYQNLYTGTALTLANYVAQRTAFQAVKRPDGKPMGFLPDTLLVHPEEEQIALEIVKADKISGASSNSPGSRTNVMAGTARVVVMRQGGAPGVWYLAATKYGKRVSINPLVVQVRKAPVLIANVNPMSPNVYNKRLLQWSAEARYAFGYGRPWQMFRMEA